MIKKVFVLLVAVAATSGSAMATIVATFDSKDTGTDGYYLPETSGTHDWTDAGMMFNLDVNVDPDYGTSWSGFTYSSVNDTTTEGSDNQYAVYKPGIDVSGTGVYAVGYVGGVTPQIFFTSATEVQGLYLNNTTYAALDMREGSGFSKEFEAGDWFKLTIEGLGEQGDVQDDLEFYLANFTGYQVGDDKDDYMLSEWTWVDLTSLGSQVGSLRFELSSSDNDPDWGMNTPAYFAVDNVTIIPEPSALVLLTAFAMVSLVLRRRRP